MMKIQQPLFIILAIRQWGKRAMLEHLLVIGVPTFYQIIQLQYLVEVCFFTLKIPNLHFARYHLGIVDTSGNKILLHEQANYQEPNNPVTHWGADTRTISTTIRKSETTGNYYTSGYSDWAGIDQIFFAVNDHLNVNFYFECLDTLAVYRVNISRTEMRSSSIRF